MIPATTANSLGVLGTRGQQNPTGHDAFQAVDMQSFVKLLVAELTSQDPLEPMDNAQILQQISQIRDITATDRLTESLDAIKMGQNMATAAGLIDQTIVALSDEGQQVRGKVDRVSIEFGVPKLHVGEDVIDMRNVAGIASDEAALNFGDETGEAGGPEEDTQDAGA